MSANKIEVLVIDDEPPIRKLLRMGLNRGDEVGKVQALDLRQTVRS